MCIRDRVSTQSTWGKNLLLQNLKTTNMAAPALTFGYWGVQGRAEPVRLLLALSGLEWTQKKYSDPQEWFGKDKPALNHPFPNLPYIKDGDVAVAETVAVAQYVALRANREDLWGGKTPQDRVTFTTLRGVLTDAKGLILSNNWNAPDGIESGKKISEEKVFPILKKISAFLGTKDFLLGYVTYADCQLFDLINWVVATKPVMQETFQNLKDFQARFASLPQISAYLKSDKHLPKFLNPNFQESYIVVAPQKEYTFIARSWLSTSSMNVLREALSRK
eukprot:TRINITY_DN66_c0_g1_i3.p1 TRINITY_DN66_c0_g1~~TRINITY_DN66_c0_g1_i3.p1  ORF type:complete len:277 (-),score=95.76 TRINITY_DN66_c0_g1_i3:257-1087(-)